MVDFNWRIDVVCVALLLPLKLIPIMRYRRVQDDQCFIPTFGNPFLEFLNTVLSSYNTFSQVAGVVPLGFTIFFIRSGRELFHLFCSFFQDGIKKPRSSSLRECNACTVRFFFTKNTLLVEVTYFLSCWEG
jgi:hypothetical protein